MENKRNRVLLCLGSNWDKEKNMERAAEMLRAHFVFIQFSQPVYTEPIDCPLSTTFLNRVAVLYSEESPARIKDVLIDIEFCIG
ncbi:MAG: 2-amino-4-hydroxy-6-hydroxymethyldihydropteridine diphosphokinase, partial [Parabacteroides sp.]|nr:2-amino-4-hydroxy-6-hydroxymethyldihydropteridine diphosphokinase [Parabacteroides sp.]